MKLKQVPAALAVAGVVLALADRPSFAVGVSDLLVIVQLQSAQIAALEKRVEDLEARLETAPLAPATLHAATPSGMGDYRQQVALASRPAAVAVDSRTSAGATVEGGGLEIKWAPSPTLKSTDGLFEAHLRGRVQADYGFADDTAGFGSTSATELRSARLGIEGTAWRDVEYKLELDFADNEVRIDDAYAEYDGMLDPWFVRLGQFKTPNSLDEQTALVNTTFMERAAFTDAFGFDRRIGAAAGGHGQDWSLELGVFGQGAGNDADQDNTQGYDEGYAVAGRATHAMDLGANELVHLGISGRYRDLANDVDDGLVRYRQRPFIHGTDIHYVDTGSAGIPADSDTFAGVELAFVSGPFSVQAEAGALWVDGTADADPWFWGGYADVSYFLTGETRPYRGGRFGRIKVEEPFLTLDGRLAGPGAWQVAARLDYIDLSSDGVEGGEQTSAILGFNWHLNDHARLMLDYAYNRVTGGPADVNGADGNNVIHAVGARAQVDF